MTASLGSGLEDQIRQSLAPLGETLRIDAFLSLMMRERARVAAEESRARQSEQEREAPPRQAGPERQPDPGETLRLRREDHLPAEDANLEEEVSDFLRRDEVEESSSDEVSEFMEILGGGGYHIEDPDR